MAIQQSSSVECEASSSGVTSRSGAAFCASRILETDSLRRNGGGAREPMAAASAVSAPCSLSSVSDPTDPLRTERGFIGGGGGSSLVSSRRSTSFSFLSSRAEYNVRSESAASDDSDMPPDGSSLASGVIHPPSCVPASVGCSNRRPVEPSEWTSMVNHGLLYMPMTFHVKFLGCVFIVLSHARHATRLARATSKSGSLMAQLTQPKYFPAAFGVLGGWDMSSSWTRCHEMPSSNVTSTRMTSRPPPE
mmetsp:Transcript_10026/g.33079  ORF Transcript_10026/g.33079 Transcript_10026/m.33079 type:complete len:248 (-) Transcript_10026:887-1630(-)